MEATPDFPGSTSDHALPRSFLAAYAAPGAGFMVASLPLSLWFGKFATDTLLMPVAALGAIVLVARVWDGVSDPIAGYYSDRTRSARGRRRSWMLASLLPIVLSLVALWTPPPALEGLALILWVGAAYVLWETASTVLYVPYLALGNELTSDHHERTRLFAWRHVISIGGYALSLGVVYLLRTSAARSSLEGRETATALALCAGIVLSLCVYYAVRQISEPAEHQDRGAENVWGAFRDVFRNPHARVLLVVYAIEAFGMGSIAFLTPYVLDNVLGDISYLEAVLAVYMVPQFIFVPLWVKLSKRIGKRSLWVFGMLLYALGFGLNVLTPFYGVAVLISIVFVLGVGGGISSIVSLSIQADVIDWDELQTGERKEGAYTAIWNMIRKSGWGIAAGLGGLALGIAGYDGAAEVQTDTVKWTIVFLASVVPASAYLIGAFLMGRFKLNESEHANVMDAIAERRATEDAGGR